jgi:hypothetical protein
VTTRGRRLALLAALIACAAPVGAAQAGNEREQDNIAVATTEEDGSRVFDFAWSLDRQRGGIVDHRNIANAAARCTDCRATSIAFQIVLVVGQPDELTPRNQAVAINDQCTGCTVYAGARQFVRVVDRQVRFTRSGARTLRDVRSDLRALEGQDLTADQLAAEVEAQEARVLTVVTDELVPAGGRGHQRVLDRRDRQADDD